MTFHIAYKHNKFNMHVQVLLYSKISYIIHRTIK